MSTVPASTSLPARRRARAAAWVPARTRAASDPARMIALGLLALVAYAAFDHGAVGTASGARIEVMVCVLAALAAGVWLLHGSALTVPMTRAAVSGLGLMALFAVWSAISLAWSVAPDGTWLELNRVVAYVLVLAIALGLGAAGGSLLGLLADGLLVVTGAVTLYAIAQKLVPELHLGSLIDLGQAGPIPRLQEPLGYWNALALFIALGLPLALFRGLDTSRSPRSRIASLCLAQVMLVTIGLTLSRGGLLALLVALAAVAPLAGAGLRTLMWSLVVTLAALPSLILGLSLHALSSTGVSLSSRAGAGALLALLLVVSLAALGAGARWLAFQEATRKLEGENRRRVNAVLGGLSVGVVLAVVLALAVSSRGLGGEISHAWSSFTANPSGSIYDPQHLLSQDSEHRWVWWKEAAGAFSDRPLAGWGAGSFPVVHLLYRRDRLSVNEPHSLPLQFLAETGLIGALLALSALALLLIAAVRAVLAQPPGRTRLTSAALLAGAIAFLVQALYDWDWDIPGVAIPGLVLLGLLAGSLRRRADSTPPSPAVLRPRTGMSGGPVALLAVVVMLCTVGLSDAVPSLAAGDAASALVEAGNGSAASLQHALADARLADSLDPLSDSGLKVEATIALRRHELDAARGYLVQAVGREPADVSAWQQLSEVDLLLGYLEGAAQAAQRALALDPQGLASGQAVFLISQIEGLIGSPPRDSATATASPGPPPSSSAPPPPAKPKPTPATPLQPIVPGVNSTPSTGVTGTSPATSQPGGGGSGTHHTSSASGTGTFGGSGGNTGQSGTSGNSGQAGSTTTTPEPPVTTPTTPTPPPTTPTITTPPPTPPQRPSSAAGTG